MRDLFLIHFKFGMLPNNFGIALDSITFILRCLHELCLSVVRVLQVSVLVSEICHSGFSDISMLPDSVVCRFALIQASQHFGGRKHSIIFLIQVLGPLRLIL